MTARTTRTTQTQTTPGDSHLFEEIGGFEVQRYVVAELNEERQRRVRIDSQGASLIQGSTALATLAFAATTLVTGTTSWTLPRLSLWTLGVTFAAFMVTAFCGLRGGGKIHRNQTVPLATLTDWTQSDQMWLGDRAAAGRQHLLELIRYLGEIRGFNNDRATWVVWGSRAQVLALFGLIVSVAVILIDAMYPEASGWHHILDPPH